MHALGIRALGLVGRGEGMTARRLKRVEQLSPPTRYELLVRLAAGGMGVVYVGRSLESASSGLVAIKRAHAHLLDDPTFREMFVAEARLASRIVHPRVVGVRDVDESDGELLLVMDYVEGASFADLLTASQEQGRRLPHAVAIRIVLDAALGLEAAHSVRDESGKLIGMVHRDVSPHNVLVGLDGVARIFDFGVAKAIDHEGTETQSGILKGKAAYMAPEYLNGRSASPQSDVFSLGVVAWEGLTNRRLFRADDELRTMQRILDPSPAPRPSDIVAIDLEIDAVVARALEKDRAKRFATAKEMADALEAVANALDLIASPAEVGALVESLVGERLASTRVLVREAIDASERSGFRRRVEETKTVFVVSTEAIERAAPAAIPSMGRGLPTVQMAQVEESPPRGSFPDPVTVPRPDGAVTIAMPMPAASPTVQLIDSARTARGTLMTSPAPLFAPTPAQLHPAPTLSFTPIALPERPRTTSRPAIVASVIGLVAIAAGAGIWAMTARTLAATKVGASERVEAAPTTTADAKSRDELEPVASAALPGTVAARASSASAAVASGSSVALESPVSKRPQGDKTTTVLSSPSEPPQAKPPSTAFKPSSGPSH